MDGPVCHASVEDTTVVNQNLSGTDKYIKIHRGHTTLPFPEKTVT